MRQSKKGNNSSRNREVIYGVNPILETLKAGNRKIYNVLVKTGALGKALRQLIDKLESKNIPIDFTSIDKIAKLANCEGHQGVIAQVSPVNYFNFDELTILAKKCLEHSSLLVVDEAYYHFSEVSAINLLDEFENVIIVRTFSKAFGVAGLRLGYTIAQDQTITYLKALKHIYEVNSITAAIGVYLIENLHIMKNYVDDVNKGRDILSSYFSSVGCNLHGLHSNTLLVELPKEYNCNKIEQVAKDAGYLIKSQVIYPTMNHLRITLGPPDQMQSFIKAIDWCFETK